MRKTISELQKNHNEKPRFRRPDVLTPPVSEPGYVYRWVKINSFYGGRDVRGWEVVKVKDNHRSPFAGKDAMGVQGFGDCYRYGDLVFCRMSVAENEQLNELPLKSQNAAQMMSIKHPETLSSHSSPEMDRYMKGSTTVEWRANENVILK